MEGLVFRTESPGRVWHTLEYGAEQHGGATRFEIEPMTAKEYRTEQRIFSNALPKGAKGKAPDFMATAHELRTTILRKRVKGMVGVYVPSESGVRELRSIDELLDVAGFPDEIIAELYKAITEVSTLTEDELGKLLSPSDSSEPERTASTTRANTGNGAAATAGAS